MTTQTAPMSLDRMFRSSLLPWGSIASEISLGLLLVGMLPFLDNRLLGVVGYTAAFQGFSFAFALATSETTTILVSRSLGGKTPSQAPAIVATAAGLGALATLAFCLAVFLMWPQLVDILSIPPDLQGVTLTLWIFLSAEVLFRVLLFALLGYLRSLGQMRLYSALNIAPAVLQMVGVLALIAWYTATEAPELTSIVVHVGCVLALAKAVALLAALIIMSSRLQGVRAELRSVSMTQVFATLRSIFITSIFTPIVMFLFGFLISASGEDSAAAFALISRLQPVLFSYGLALSSVAVPILSWYFGRADFQNMRRAFDKCLVYLVGVQLAVYVAAIALAEAFIFAAMSVSDQVISNLRIFLWIVPLTYAAMSMFSISVRVFNIFERHSAAMMFAMLRSFAVSIPFVSVGFFLADYLGVLLGYAAANMLSSIPLYVLARNLMQTTPAPTSEASHG